MGATRLLNCAPSGEYGLVTLRPGIFATSSNNVVIAATTSGSSVPCGAVNTIWATSPASSVLPPDVRISCTSRASLGGRSKLVL